MADEREFHVLDGMRGIAALVVLQRHAAEGFGGSPLPGGYLAVDFFFALSGFVLAHAYDQRLANGLSGGRFMLQRLIRLYPLYFIGTILMLIATPQAWPNAEHEIAVSALFLPDFASPLHAWLIPPAWSLAFELLVNLGFAIAHRHLSNKVLVAILAVSGVTLLGAAMGHGSLDTGFTAEALGNGLARAAFSFSLGVFLYRNRQRWRPADFKVSAWLPISALVLTLAIPAAGPWTIVKDMSVVGLLLPLLLIVGSMAHAGAASRPLILGLGAASYAVYVLHSSAIALVELAGARPGPIGAWIVMIVFVALCMLADRFYDRPVRRWLTERLPIAGAQAVVR